AKPGDWQRREQRDGECRGTRRKNRSAPAEDGGNLRGGSGGARLAPPALVQRIVIMLAIVAASACQDARGNESAIFQASGGDAARGRAALVQFGCGACHTIPGVRGATALVGPPLNSWGRRAYIAGELPNNPLNLI